MSRPRAVIISDIHFTPATLEPASTALRQAQEHAVTLKVPLIIAGDTLDSKAVIRGECANRLIEILKDRGGKPWTYILVGNHDLLNEKGAAHALEFLKPYCNVVQSPVEVAGLYLIPYMANADALQAHLDTIPKGSTLIMHTGVQSAFMGHYVVDKSSLPQSAFADFRVISGHYHRAQDIKTGRPRKGAVGLFSYIGNPYSLSFGEAADGPKGFQVLYDDGLLEQVPTNLRKHVVLERTAETADEPDADLNPGDLLWLKVTGTYQELERLNKHKIGMSLLGHGNYRLEKIYTDTAKPEAEEKPRTGEHLMDALIDGTGESELDRAALKSLWRGLV